MKKANPKFLGSLEEVMELIVRWHYFGEALTLDETSKVLGISRSAVKAIEVRALPKLKQELAKRYKIKSTSDVFDESRGRIALDVKGSSGLE